ncbi:hypothetical protein V6238_01505 [Marinomonas arenicola]|uniref:DUF7673 family protein n=1 Tax=Marinomonas arenicola TaxID=569601 RepID=UPI00311EA9FE
MSQIIEPVKASDFAVDQNYEAALTKNGVTEREYEEAVETLVSLAQGGSGASELAAHILLSLSNGNAYQVPLSSFMMLDALNFDAALSVIKGHRSCFCSPNNAIQNGDAIFSNLKKRWPTLSINY